MWKFLVGVAKTSVFLAIGGLTLYLTAFPAAERLGRLREAGIDALRHVEQWARWGQGELNAAAGPQDAPRESRHEPPEPPRCEPPRESPTGSRPAAVPQAFRTGPALPDDFRRDVGEVVASLDLPALNDRWRQLDGWAVQETLDETTREAIATDAAALAGLFQRDVWHVDGRLVRGDALPSALTAYAKRRGPGN